MKYLTLFRVDAGQTSQDISHLQTAGSATQPTILELMMQSSSHERQTNLPAETPAETNHPRRSRYNNGGFRMSSRGGQAHRERLLSILDEALAIKTDIGNDDDDDMNNQERQQGGGESKDVEETNDKALRF